MPDTLLQRSANAAPAEASAGVRANRLPAAEFLSRRFFDQHFRTGAGGTLPVLPSAPSVLLFVQNNADLFRPVRGWVALPALSRE
jgi:hypothetical protein